MLHRAKNLNFEFTIENKIFTLSSGMTKQRSILESAGKKWSIFILLSSSKNVVILLKSKYNKRIRKDIWETLVLNFDNSLNI